MLARLRHRHFVKLAEVLSELGLIGSRESGVLLATEVEHEGGDRLDIVGRSCVTNFVGLNGAKHNFGVFVSLGRTLVGRLELHAGATVRSPEINDHSWVLLDDFR